MSVIVDLSVPAEEFGLGQVIEADSGTVSLETVVPLGEESVPFFRFFDETPERFEEAVREHPAIDRIREVEVHDEEALYALDWTVSEDRFFEGILDTDATLVEAAGTTDVWRFKLRFSSREDLSVFQEHCIEAEITHSVERVYEPTELTASPRYGLTDPQHEALVRATEMGYYAIPRETSTAEVARELGISDQAVTERLRRATRTLVRNALLTRAPDR